MNIPVPTIMIKSIYDLDPTELAGMGISFLLMDLDNTLAPYSISSAPLRLRNWIDSVRRAGICPFILSNNKGDRPVEFAKDLSLEYVRHAKKPDTAKLLEVLESKNVSPENAAIIGDQIYTDVLCGSRAGITTIAVRPISLRNPLHLVRYWLEVPFRLAYRCKSK